MLTKAPRGTKDVTPSDVYKWTFVEDMFREICEKFGYREVRTPVFEHTELFKRGVGETTDIVQKEMYTFTDNGDRDITLKPEGTAPVVRAFVENKLYADAQPTKLFYPFAMRFHCMQKLLCQFAILLFPFFSRSNKRTYFRPCRKPLLSKLAYLFLI